MIDASTAIQMLSVAALGLGGLAAWLWFRLQHLHHKAGLLRENGRDLQGRLKDLEARLENDSESHLQQENKLRGYLQLLDTLINTIPNPIYFKDQNGVIQGCNRAFARDILSLDRARVVGCAPKELYAMIDPDLSACLRTHDAKITAGHAKHHFEAKVPSNGGRRRDFLFNIASVKDNQGHGAGSVGVMLDLTTNAYMTQTLKTLSLFDVFWGFLKAAVFALLIAGIGCLRGFQVRGGAAEVGQATTSAVVSSIFLIILADAFFAVILRYWG